MPDRGGRAQRAVARARHEHGQPARDGCRSSVQCPKPVARGASRRARCCAWQNARRGPRPMLLGPSQRLPRTSPARILRWRSRGPPPRAIVGAAALPWPWAGSSPHAARVPPSPCSAALRRAQHEALRAEGEAARRNARARVPGARRLRPKRPPSTPCVQGNRRRESPKRAARVRGVLPGDGLSSTRDTSSRLRPASSKKE